MTHSVRNLLISFAIVIVVVLLIVLRTFSTLRSQVQEHETISQSRLALQTVGPSLIDMEEFQSVASRKLLSRDTSAGLFLDSIIARLRTDSAYFAGLTAGNASFAEEYALLAGMIHRMIFGNVIPDTNSSSGANLARIGYRMPLMDSFKSVASAIESAHRQQLQNSYSRSIRLSRDTAAFMRIICLLLVLFLLVSFWFIFKDIRNKQKESHRLAAFAENLERQVVEKASAIRKNEEKYRELFESMTDAYARVDMSGKIRECNPAFRNMIGYSMDEVAGLSYREITPEKWIAKDEAVLEEQLLPRGFSEVYEKEYRHKDGHLLPVELKTFLLRDEAGNPSAMWAIIRDISSRKEAEKKLEASVQNLSYALSSTTDVFYVIDKDFRITVLNETAEHNLRIRWGKKVEVGSNVLSLLPTDRYDNVKHRFEEAIRGKRIEYEVYQPEFGLPPWVLVTFSPIFDRTGNVVGASITGKDITARKIAEQNLKRSEQQLLASIENTPNVAVQWYNEKGEIKFWNRASERLFGWTASEVLGKKAGSLIFDNESLEMFSGLFASAIESGATIGPTELKFHTRDGREGYCISTFFSIPSDEGGQCIACMSVDMTAQKKIESELREAEAKFRNLVEQSLTGVYITHQGVLTYVNPRFAMIFGYDAGELVNQVSINQLITLGNGHLPVPTSNENIHMKFEATGTRKDGAAIELEVYTSNMLDGNRPAVIGTLLDISERKQAEREKETVRRQLNERVKELTALYRVSEAFQKENRSVKELLEEIVTILPDGWQYPESTAVRIKIGNLECRTKNFGTAFHRQSVRFPTPDGELGVIEVIYVTRLPLQSDDAFLFEERNLINIVGEMLRIYLARQHEGEQNRKMQHEILNRRVQEQKTVTRAVLQAEERERNKMGRELHDNVNQILASAKLFLKSAAEKNIWADDGLLARSIDLLENAIEEIRLLSQSQVTPSKEIDLKELLTTLVDRLHDSTSLRATLAYEKMPALQDDLKLNIYRIVQEQINNILKHAGASEIMISVVCEDDFIHVAIRDNGQGFDVHRRRRGVGLNNMINRVESFNGQLQVTSSPGTGCVVDIRIPC